jgi:hypothetical protein
MGHFSHGACLALGSQVLRYGFLTNSGSTGGVSTDDARAGQITETNTARNSVKAGDFMVAKEVKVQNRVNAPGNREETAKACVLQSKLSIKDRVEQLRTKECNSDGKGS